MAKGVCEKCWRDACARAAHMGGTVSERYTELIIERQFRMCTPNEQKYGSEDEAPKAASPVPRTEAE